MVNVSTYSGYFDVPESHRGILDKGITTVSACIYGLGHLGSWIAYALSSLGVHRLSLHDFDTIEPRNLSGSVYCPNDVGKLKAAALGNIIANKSLMGMTKAANLIDASVSTLGYAINSDHYGFVYQPFSDFYILATDNTESRERIAKTIFKQWNMCGHVPMFSNINPVLIDARSGGASLCVMNVPIRDETMQRRYLKDLEILAAEPGEVRCDESNIIQVPMFVASIVSQIITSFVRGKEGYWVYHGSLLDMGRYPFRVEIDKYLPKV